MTDDDDDGARATRFRHLREIARGGMGRVSEVADGYLRRTVALKEALGDDVDTRTRFAREVAITARLEHPSIIPVYDAGVTPAGTPFYVMRRVSGRPLDAVIAASPALDERLRLLPHLLAVADAVAHAHQRGVIHRDLKPANILIGELGETVVIDWGLAKVMAEDEPAPGRARTLAADGAHHTVVGAVVGTPGYMAPEQARGEDVDARADVYALGACAFHLLAGAPPATMSTADLTSPRRPVAPVRTIRALGGVPAELVTIIDRAMAPNAAERYEDAGGLGEDLRRFLGGQLVASHRYGRLDRAVRWIRRRAVRAVIAVAAVVVSAVGVVSLQRVLRERRRAEAALVGERARAEDLIVTQAASYLATNPTLAVATLTQLPPGSPRWRRVSSIALEARAAGVAVGYSAPSAEARVALPPTAGDSRALIYDRAEVRIADLATRTARTLATGLASIDSALFCGGDLIAILDADGVLAIDPRDGRRARLARPGPIQMWRCVDDIAVYLAQGGALFAADLRPGPAPAWTTLATDATLVEASRTGRWLAIARGARTELWRRGSPGGWARAAEIPAAADTLAFAPGEARLAITTDDGQGRELDLATAAPTVVRSWPHGRTPRYLGDALWVIEAMETGAWSWRPLAADAPTAGAGQAWLVPPVAAWTTLARATGPREITLAAGSARFVIPAPETVTQLAGAPDLPYLLAIGYGRVLAFDLRDVVATGTPTATTARELWPLEPDRVLGAVDADQLVPYRIADDGRAEAAPPLARLPLAPTAVARDTAIVFDPTGEAPPAIVAPPAPAIDAPGVVAISPIDAAAWLAGTRSGAVLRADRGTGRVVERLADLGEPVTRVIAQRGWLVAVGARGARWRRAPSGRVEAVTDGRPRVLLDVGDDGTALLSDDNRLAAWPPGRDAALDLATAPAPIVGGCSPAGSHVVAIQTHDGAVLEVADAGGEVVPLLPPSERSARSMDCARFAATVDDGVAVAEVATGESWRLAVRMPVTGLAILDDGALVIAGHVHAAAAGQTWNDLQVFRLPTRDAAVAWVHGATNALPPAGARDAIRWAALPE